MGDRDGSRSASDLSGVRPRPSGQLRFSDEDIGRRGTDTVILLTRLNGHKLVVNAELIKTVEATPDTTLTLINGDRMMVGESVEEVVRRAVEYGRQLRAFATA